MARFTKIPETNIAGTLGGLVGKAAGTITGNATITLEKLQDRLVTACRQEVTRVNQSITTSDFSSTLKELDQAEQTLNTIEHVINGVEKQTGVLNTTLKSIQVPIVALKAAILVVKVMPLPQMYLVTTVSTMLSDLLETLSELVAQIEQIVATLVVAVQIILDMLQKIRDMIERLRKIIAALKVSLTFSSELGNLTDQDQKLLTSLGILNKSGQSTNLFSKLGVILSEDHSDIIWLGNLNSIDTGSLTVQNQVKAAEPGTIINVSTDIIGNWITYVYKHSKSQPAGPDGKDPHPTSWSLIEPLNVKDEWYSKGTVSGMTGKVLSWATPKPYSTKFPKAPGQKTEEIKPATKPVHVYRMSKDRLNITEFNLEETHAIVLENGDEGYIMLYELLDTLDKSTLSQDIKNNLIVNLNTFEDNQNKETGELGVEYYRSPAGDLYRLQLCKSTRSPQIATLRYVQVTDEAGVVVYEGTESFATKPEILFEETKVRLSQLFG